MSSFLFTFSQITHKAESDMKNNDQFVFMADAHIKGRTWTNYMGLQGDAYAALDLVRDRLSLGKWAFRLLT